MFIFAAEMTRNYGRFSAWAGLEGKVYINENDDKMVVHCYIGDSLYVCRIFDTAVCVAIFFAPFIII